jgi:hypothetical protein
MKVTERLAIIERLASELHARYDFIQASVFLRAFYPKAHTYADDYADVREMTTANLVDVPESVLGEMIDDLGIESLTTVSYQSQPPTIWTNANEFRIFVSHISKDKAIATRMRDALKAYGAKAFVAHEDIEPTADWQVQIERALHSMDLFLSIHTSGYAGSIWCQQEIGFAVAKGTKVVAIRMGEDPKGFISKHQALSRGAKKAEDIAAEIDGLLLKDERTRARYEAAKAFYEMSIEVPF